MSILLGRDCSRALTASINTNNAADVEQLFCASPVLMDETSKLSTIGKLAFTSLSGAELTKQLGTDGSRTSKDGDSFAYTSGGSSGENSPTHAPREATHPKERRRRSFLRKLTRR